MYVFVAGSEEVVSAWDVVKFGTNVLTSGVNDA